MKQARASSPAVTTAFATPFNVKDVRGARLRKKLPKKL
jgi:hypothetical protein